MYSLDSLINDVANRRGSLLKQPGQTPQSDYYKVWDTFIRYASTAIDETRTLSVNNVLQIGWKMEPQIDSKPRMRPHFELAETFCQQHGLKGGFCAPAAEGSLAPAEELNYSKAAIRHSNELNKDNVFTGLKQILCQLGEALASGQPVCIDFEFGKLICQDREPRFEFLPELYQLAGLPVPDYAADYAAADYRPSVTFAPPTDENMSHLNLQGYRVGSEPSEASVPVLSPSHGRGDMRQGDVALPVGLGGVTKQQHAHNEALNRHIAQLEAQAREAVTEQEQFQDHLGQCLAEEQRDLSFRRSIAKDNADHVREQMRKTEEKKRAAREFHVEQASVHNFPIFTEPPKDEVKTYIRDKQCSLRSDLEKQIEAKRTIKEQNQQMQSELARCHLETTNQEIVALRQESLKKKAEERAALTQAWDRDARLRQVKKSIEEYKGVGSKGVTTIAVAPNGPSPRGVATQERGVAFDLPPKTASSFGSRLSTASTRTPRRTPIGAAASLTLQRDKLMAGR